MNDHNACSPGIVIAALRGGSGKTILSIGIIAAWKQSGKKVAPFKKGPDYIDAGWLALAAGRPCHNLDTFLCTNHQVNLSYQLHSNSSDIAVVEGNRGLYDGIDIEGSTSTAEIAKLLNLPVILCIDGTKTTRTMAAAVLGCVHFDPKVKIKGIILNRVAGARHENILRKSIEYHCGIPVLGAVPKLKQQDFPERHMGLVPTPEHDWATDSINSASQIANKHINLDAIADIANETVNQKASDNNPLQTCLKLSSNKKKLPLSPRIGIFKDSAFQFYYLDNIEALKEEGAEICFLSPLQDKSLPNIDALYIGGGFPETHAEKLADNLSFREKVKTLAEQGLPIYAECGGLMYLGDSLIMGNRTYPMTGVLPITFGISKKPQGHGYTISRVEAENPYFKVGTEIKGHEFRYSKVLKWEGNENDLIFSTLRGTGFIDGRDGIRYKNVLACYTHIHALGTPCWAEALVRNAIEYAQSKKGK